jgi:hypothetical protein
MLMHVHMLLHRRVHWPTGVRSLAGRAPPGRPRRQSEPARVASASTPLPRSPLVIQR